MWKIRPPSFGSRKNYKQECKNTRPIRPSARMRLEPPSRADHRAAKRAEQLSENNDIAMKIKCFPDKRARRAEDFHFPLFFMSGRNPGASACPDLILPELAGRKARVYLKIPQRCSILPKSPICCVAFACIPQKQPRRAHPADEAAKARLAQRSGFRKRAPSRAAKIG